MRSVCGGKEWERTTEERQRRIEKNGLSGKNKGKMSKHKQLRHIEHIILIQTRLLNYINQYLFLYLWTYFNFINNCGSKIVCVRLW